MTIKIYRDKIIELVHPNCYLYFESGMSIIYPRKEHFQNNVYLLTLEKVKLELCELELQPFKFNVLNQSKSFELTSFLYFSSTFRNCFDDVINDICNISLLHENWNI